jgi:hypothetical protein
MHPTGLIVIGISAVLIVFAVLCAVVGGILWCFRVTRAAAPLILFTPTLALLGGVVGAWSFAFLSGSLEHTIHEAPIKGWLIGLPLGGFSGAALGLVLALAARKRLLNRDTQQRSLQ